MTTPLPIQCLSCQKKQLNCNVASHIKGSCIQCIVDHLECLFPSPSFLHNGSFSNAPHLFQKNCVQCTIRHRKCIFDVNNQSSCNRCIKFGLPCVFKLSSQGQRNDISASTTVSSTAAYAKQAVTTTTTATSVSITLSPTTTAPTTHSTLAMMAPKAVMTVVEDKPEHRFDYANESVQYHHHFDGDSCHGCVDQVSVLGKSLPSVRPSFTIPPPWVHVFSKSCQPSIAYMEDSIHTKVQHCQNRHRRKKLIKQEKFLQKLSSLILSNKIYCRHL